MIDFVAPGRVTLIGEHVDYAGGLVLPAAIEQGVRLRAAVTDDGLLRLVSRGHPGEAVIPVAHEPAHPAEGWARFPAAVVAELRVAGVELRGLAGELRSDLPAASGLSSSAALAVCIAGALVAAAGNGPAGLELAAVCQRAEHRAIGMPCGLMDQAASVLGRAGHAVLLDCATLEHRLVRLPEDIVLVVVGSGVQRALETSGYAERRREVEEALRVLAPARPRSLAADEALALAVGRGLGAVPLARLRHVVGELARVQAVVGELECPGGPDRVRLGRLFADGHRSLRDDFDVSVPELDLLVALSYEEGAVAARMTGGGFGGAIVALVPKDDATPFAGRVSERFAARFGRPAPILVTAAGDGARRL